MDKDSLFENSIWGDKAIAKWNAENKDKKGFKKQKTIDELAKEYNQYHVDIDNDPTEDERENFKARDNGDDFSWVLESDKTKLDVEKGDQSIRWGIPNQIIGDPASASFFLCLLNPRTRNSKISADSKSLQKFITAENEEKDLNSNNQKEYFSNKNLYKYQKHIIDTSESELVKELAEVKAIKKPVFNDYYYLHSYYNYILRDNSESEKDVFEKYGTDGKKVLNNKNVCNLELFPYRTNDGAGIKFNENPKGRKLKNGGKSHYTFRYLTSSKYVASIIIDKIEENKDKKELYFVFRSYSSWYGVIRQCIKDQHPEFSRKDINEKIGKMENYFYKVSSRRARLTMNSIVKVKENKKLIDFKNNEGKDIYRNMKEVIEGNLL